MASFSEEDGILRIPATSPCRRDYQLRSFSSTQGSECDSSRPQSPWQPRSESQSEEVSTFRLYESNPAPLDRSNFYSGPLPGAQQGDSRSYYSGPLPGAQQQSVARSLYGGPLPCPSPVPSYFNAAALPSFMSPTTESFAFRTGARGRQLVESGSVCGGLPEVGSSRESSFRGEEGMSAAEEDDVDEVGEVPYTSYLSKEDERCAPRSSRPSPMPSPMPSPSATDFLVQKQSGVMRKCVSGELGTRFEIAQQKASVARGYKSGEIVGLEIRADGIYPSAEMRMKDGEAKGVKEVGVGKLRPSGSISWETLNDVERESPNCELAMVAIPFKWEEVPGKVRDSTKKATSRTSSTSRLARNTREQKVTSESRIGAANESCFGSSHRFYGVSEKGTEKTESERWNEAVDTSEAKPVAPAAAKLVKSSSVSSAKPKPQEVVISAVPFKWEVAPGKPKVEEKASSSPKAAPALQLPPSRRNSIRRISSETAPANGVRQPSRSLSSSVSTSSSVKKHSIQSQQEVHSPHQQSPSSQEANPCRTLAKAFHSSPLDNTARPSDFTPKRGASGPISQFGLPQYQSADYLCEDSVSWNRGVRSPTSTLCGPGSDSLSNPSSCSDKSSRKSSVSFANSLSGASAESFEHWSYGDHISPTSRHHKFPESEGFSRTGSVRGHEEGDQIPTAHGTMTKLRRKLNMKTSSSKPPMSPIRSSQAAPATPSPSVDANGYSSHGEEFFDCHCSGSSPSPSSIPIHVELPSDTEEEVEPATRLPYKMPSPAHDMEPQVESASSSPTRAVPEFTNCLGLPKFLSKGDTPCLWVQNPSWDLPSAPTNVVEDGYRSPAYKATLELLSPAPDVVTKKNGSRSVKLPRSSSSRRRHPHLVEVLCNSLKQSLQRCTKRSVTRTTSIVLYDDPFTKRHQSFVW